MIHNVFFFFWGEILHCGDKKIWENLGKKPLKNCEMHYFLFIGGFDWHGGYM
jgi:hypothetical protein